MLLAPAEPSRSLWRFVCAGIVLPTLIAAVDHALFTSLASGWRLDLWLTALPMAVLVLQIGVMGFVCGSWTPWPLMGWILYCWSWFLVDLQALLVRQLAVENIFGRNAAFLTGSLFAAQLSLVLVWAILGQTRWSTRWPLALLIGTLLSIPLLDLMYAADNAALFFLTQLATTGGICTLLRWQQFQLSRRDRRTASASLPPSVEALPDSQFGLKHMLAWTTALALVMSLLRLIGLPWDAWANAAYLRAWLVFVSSGIAVGIVLVVAIWAALSTN